MKIKTITCHDVYNVGASLQAYALVTYLRKLGHDAQIIDYKPDYLSNHYPLWGLGNPAYDKPILRELYNLAKLPGRLKARNGKAEYDRFTAEFLPLTPRRYTSNDDLKQNPPEADVYFAGSDQIWNCFFPNGKDPAFYLDFAPAGSVRASYAASFAMDDIPEEWKPDVKRRLSGLDHISVRESSGHHSGAGRAAGVKGGADYEARYTGFSELAGVHGRGYAGYFRGDADYHRRDLCARPFHGGAWGIKT